MGQIKSRSPWTFQSEFLFELCFFSQNFVIEADGIGILLEKQLASTIGIPIQSAEVEVEDADNLFLLYFNFSG